MKLCEQTSCELTVDGEDLLNLLRDRGFGIPKEGINIFLSKKSPYQPPSNTKLGSRYMLRIKWTKETEIPPDHKVNA